MQIPYTSAYAKKYASVLWKCSGFWNLYLFEGICDQHQNHLWSGACNRMAAASDVPDRPKTAKKMLLTCKRTDFM